MRVSIAWLREHNSYGLDYSAVPGHCFLDRALVARYMRLETQPPPCVITAAGRIREGHHRAFVAELKGQKEIEAIFQEGD